MKQLDYGIKELSEYLELVDKKIKQLAPKHINGVSRLLRQQGKRLRPKFVIAVAHHSGKPVDESVVNAAAAVELVHISSLIHDDIMDKGHLRWGVPTIYTKEGVDAALLAGDYLLAKGCALAASVSGEAAIVLAETIAELCEGQSQEVIDRHNMNRTIDSLLSATRGKTSSLFVASCRLGGIVSGLDEAEIKILCRFGESFGIAFQYMDDVSDFTQTLDVAGKSVGNDCKEGNYTLPVLLSLHGPNGPQLKSLLAQGAIGTSVLKVLQADNSLHLAMQEAEIHKQKAWAELKKLRSDKLRSALAGALDCF